MNEFLSYRLSDLLLYSEQTYFRQFALYTDWLDPFHYFAALYAVFFLAAWSLRRVSVMRALAWITAVLWLICTYGFLYRLYSQINWMAGYLVPLMGAQSVLLIWAGLRTSKAEPTQYALLLGLLGLMLPVIELASGRPAEAMSAYALSPDSLSIYSLALVSMLGQVPWLAIPSLLWLLFSALSYFAMGSPLSWFFVFVLVISGISIVLNRRRTAQV